MSTIPTISEDDIRYLVGERSFSLGQQYFREKAIFNTQQQGMALKARCQGSHPEAYHVEATLDSTGVASSSCSCPVGYRCKHIAALLLTWLHQPEEFFEQQEVDTLLEQYSKAELIALIKKMLKRQPDFASLLQTVGKHTTVNPDVYRRQVEKAFRQGGYDWEDASGIKDELLEIKETADEFVQQQDYANAVAIYEAIVTGVIDNYEEYRYEDEDGELSSVIDECVEGLDKCLVAVQDDNALREKIMQILYDIFSFDIESGGIGFGEEASDIILKHATVEERQTIAGWIRDAATEEGERKYGRDWHSEQYDSFLLELEADTLDDEAFLRTCREMGRTYDVVDRLLILGRIDEVAKEIEQVDDYELAAMATLFISRGQGALIERIIQGRARQSQNTHLLEWLKQRYLERDDYAAALELAEKLFFARPIMAGYMEIRQLARELGRWEAKRQELLAFLDKSPDTYLSVQIALDEGEIDKALALVRPDKKPENSYGFYAYYDLELKVANAAEETRPRAAIEIYQNHVERLINQRGRASYQAACPYLLKIHALFEKLGENEAWTRYITDLRERNRSLRALKEEMAAAGL